MPPRKGGGQFGKGGVRQQGEGLGRSTTGKQRDKMQRQKRKDRQNDVEVVDAEAQLPRGAVNREQPEWTFPALGDTPEDPDEHQEHFETLFAIVEDDTFSFDNPDNLQQFQRLVHDIGRSFAGNDLQRKVVEEGLKKILKLLHPHKQDPRPSEQQIDTVNALIFGQSDVLMIAKTGSGKSLVFQALVLLTGMIVFLMPPLNRLGDQQANDLRREELSSLVKTCHITAETKSKKLLSDIEAGQYNLVVLGPEQAASKDIRQVLQNPALRNKIVAFVIDEIHCVDKWKNFREEYTQVKQFRDLLRRDTVMLGATATLSADTEDYVLKHSGFRKVGLGAYETKVLRSSVDRPEMKLICKEIPKECCGLKNYDMLYWMFKDASTPVEASEAVEASEGVQAQPAVEAGEYNVATLEKIKKVLGFIDGMQQIQDCSAVTRGWLLQSTKDCPDPSKKYVDGGGGKFDVNIVVCFYTAQVAKVNQDRIFDEYQKETSEIRFLLATTAFGTGLHVRDIAIVFQYRILITKSLEDLIQRLGRGGRAIDFFIAIWYMLYAVSDRERTPREHEVSIVTRSQTQSQRPRVLPGEEETIDLDRILDELVDSIDDDNVDVSARGLQLGDTPFGRLLLGEPLYWNKTELKFR